MNIDILNAYCGLGQFPGPRLSEGRRLSNRQRTLSPRGDATGDALGSRSSSELRGSKCRPPAARRRCRGFLLCRICETGSEGCVNRLTGSRAAFSGRRTSRSDRSLACSCGGVGRSTKPSIESGEPTLRLVSGNAFLSLSDLRSDETTR